MLTKMIMGYVLYYEKYLCIYNSVCVLVRTCIIKIVMLVVLLTCKNSFELIVNAGICLNVCLSTFISI